MTTPAKRGPKAGFSVKLGRADLALAYELRQDGAKMKLLASNFGVSVSLLGKLFTRCKRDGLSWLLKP